MKPFKELYNLSMVNYSKAVLPSEIEIRTILQVAAKGPIKAFDLTTSCTERRRPFVFRGLSWLLKMGILIEYK